MKQVCTEDYGRPEEGGTTDRSRQVMLELHLREGKRVGIAKKREVGNE